MSEIKAFIDGASRGNPGEAGLGVVAISGKKTVEFYAYLGSATNNWAEYCALIAALLYAQATKASSVVIYADSELVVNQMKGFYRVKNQNLKILHKQALSVAGEFEKFEINHIDREKNSKADKLANIAINLQKSSLPAEIPFEKIPQWQEKSPRLF